ncbi:hypothetical protein DERF_008254 [Dermatophagoides farinae]|uniref:Uncharacterized protein n=1 Tax=Dermatophagoides farinae TaxID=6954 RepID=A0A922I598_DERFA|nr:hypothetical protein DERF_008254 [Dermatophagoides farinae]
MNRLLSTQFSSSITPSSVIDDKRRLEDELVRGLGNSLLPSNSNGTVSSGVFSDKIIAVGETLPPLPAAAISPSFVLKTTNQSTKLSFKTSNNVVTYDANEQTAGMKMILNTADPRMVPVPISSFEMNTPITDVNNSGADVPIAIKVAPATSAEIEMSERIRETSKI